MAISKCQDSLGASDDYSQLIANGRFEEDDIKFAACPSFLSSRLDHAVKFGRRRNANGFLAVVDRNGKLNHSNHYCCPRTSGACPMTANPTSTLRP